MRVWRSRCSVEREMFVLRIFVADKFFETRGSGPRAETVRVQGNGLNKNTVCGGSIRTYLLVQSTTVIGRLEETVR